MAELADRFPAANTTGRTPRGRRWLRIVLWLLLALIVLVLLAAAAGVLRLRSEAKAALPQIDGDLHLAGLSAPVTVTRDAHGVPHIGAATQEDLFFAQGYVTAQDRLWQLDALRRNAQGRLAEVLGPSLVKHDTAQRVLGFGKVAKRVYANLDPAEKARLDAYAKGVNAFIDSHQDSLPPEFRLLFYKPEPWSGADSISIGLMMVQTLDTHWETKLGRERVAADLHDAKLESDLYPVGSWRDHPPTGEQIDWSQPRPAPAASDDDEDEKTTAGAKAPLDLRGSMYGLKPVPSTGAKAPKSLSADSARVNSCPDTKPDGDAFAVSHPCGKERRKDGAPISVPEMAWSGAEVADDRSQQAGEDENPAELRAVMGLPECVGCVSGSNNWTIAGKHTASGKPLLSNDMHLGLSVPNIWYMADLRAPGFHAAGVTLPGFPFVIAGHNEHVAWGFTALMGDVQDLYIEKLDGKGNYQAADGTWKPLDVDRETIKVRGGKDVELDVQSTVHGPLLNPMLAHETRPIALKWTLYDTTLNTLPIYAMNTAANWAEFSAALATWCWPTQNVVYSDDQGHIAYHAVGRVPERPAGLMGVPVNNSAGDGAHEWHGYIPFDAMPGSFDPPSGFLATANSRVTTEKSPYPLTLEWIDPYRTERVYKMLQGRDGLTPKDMLAVETDIYSEVDQELGHRFAYAIDHTPGADAQLRKAADLIRSWDGKLTTDSAAASLVTQTRAALWPLILEPKLGKDEDEYDWAERDFAQEEIVMRAKAGWLPKSYKSWDALLTEAVRNGMERGKAPADVSQWRYGAWHVVDLEHPLAGFLPWIGRVAGTGELPLSGDTITVKQVGRAFGPSQRFTMDWSNVDGSTEDIVLGESGNPYSPYFRDQWDDYYNGRTFALPFTPAAVAAQTAHTLRLTP